MILSRGTIHKYTGFILPDVSEHHLRTKLFILFMRIFGWSRIGVRGGIFADIMVPESEHPIRVFSLHLRQESPQARRDELEYALKYVQTNQFTIVCGDLNVIDVWYLNPFNWLMGASVETALPWYSERREMEQFFGKNGFINPLRNKRTHTDRKRSCRKRV